MNIDLYLKEKTKKAQAKPAYYEEEEEKKKKKRPINSTDCQ